jgi:hypothetical protein
MAAKSGRNGPLSHKHPHFLRFQVSSLILSPFPIPRSPHFLRFQVSSLILSPFPVPRISSGFRFPPSSFPRSPFPVPRISSGFRFPPSSFPHSPFPAFPQVSGFLPHPFPVPRSPFRLPRAPCRKRTMRKRKSGRRLGLTLRVDDGKGAGPFCGRIIGNRERQISTGRSVSSERRLRTGQWCAI